MYGLAYGISIGAGVAITLGVALDNIAIGILIGLGSGGMQWELEITKTRLSAVAVA